MTTPPAADDARLARAAGAGDQRALAVIYDRYAARVLGFAQSLLPNPAEAEDCLQEVFILAATRLRGLSEPELLCGWLFAIARNDCLARLDQRRRDAMLRETSDRGDAGDRDGRDSRDDEPSSLFESELGSLMDDSKALTDRDRLVLELADRQGLTGDNLAAAIGVSPAGARSLVDAARASARQSQGALLVARAASGRCAGLDGLLVGADVDAPSPRLVRRLNRHIDGCANCRAYRDEVATPAALLGDGRRVAPEAAALRGPVLHTAAQAAALSISDRGAIAATGAAWTLGWPPADPQLADGEHGARRWGAPVAVGAVLVLAVAIILSFLLGDFGSGSGHHVSALGIDATTGATDGATVTTEPTSSSAAISPPPSITRSSTTARKVVVAGPPSPSHAPISSSAASKLVILELTTDLHPAVVSSGRSSAGCAARTTCAYTVATGSTVTISTGGARIRLDYDAFSAPASCRTVRNNVCTFTVTSRLSIVLTTRPAIGGPQQ